MEINDLLAEASCLLTDARQEIYGDFWDNHRRIGVMWGELLQLEEPVTPEITIVPPLLFVNVIFPEVELYVPPVTVCPLNIKDFKSPIRV
jgi:hypothetical protein